MLNTNVNLIFLPACQTLKGPVKAEMVPLGDYSCLPACELGAGDPLI